MLSRSVQGTHNGVDWNIGLAVQPVTGATNAWLIGTYTLLRANLDIRAVDAGQANAGLSEVFDPVTLRITFAGNGTCSIASYSSWFGYSLTTDPAGTFSQPSGSDYGFHQAVYAGEGYAGAGGVHKDSVHTFTSCTYSLAADGRLFVAYAYNNGASTPITVTNAYFVSTDMRYLVSTVDATATVYRGFEAGVRVKTIAGAQDVRNNSIAGTYLFNAPTLELQGATPVLGAPYNEHRNAEKATQCMVRGSAVLSTTASATSGWNTCTWDTKSICDVRGEEGLASSVTMQHYTAKGSESAAACRFQVASNGSVDLVVNLDTAEGLHDFTFSGAVADNNESLVLRGKYIGTTMTNPSNTSAPERQIKNDMIVTALVGVKYNGTLTADADADGLNNLGEFTYPDFLLGANVKNDYNNDGIADWVWKGESNGYETLSQIWELTYPTYGPNYTTPTRFYPPPFSDQLNWELVTTGDFNGDGTADFLWRHKTLASWKLWQMKNGTRVGQNPSPPDFDLAHAWTVVGAGDTDKDGDDDVILNNTSTGEVMIWKMQNYAVVGTYSVGTKPGYVVNRIGDFNGDGDVDLLLRQVGGDLLVIWQIENNALVLESAFPNVTAGYDPVCAADFDGDGDADIMLVDRTTQIEKWFEVQNYARVGQHFGSSNTGFVFQGCGDYDGDGDADTIWQRSSDDANRVVLQQNWGANKQTVYTNAFGGVNPGAAGYGYKFRANRN
jgi:hypothetical protein